MNYKEAFQTALSEIDVDSFTAFSAFVGFALSVMLPFICLIVYFVLWEVPAFEDITLILRASLVGFLGYTPIIFRTIKIKKEGE